MSTELHAPPPSPREARLASLTRALAEDALTAIAAGAEPSMLEDVAKRRGEAYSALLGGHALHTLAEHPDAYRHEMTRVLAPVRAPDWLPMGAVLAEHVTLEGGPRGLRSLFSSKPSDKDVQRVRSLGTLAARVLRAVAAADGPLDGEEQAALQSFVAALGLPERDAAALLVEPVMDVADLDLFGDLERGFVKALLRGAWFAAAGDQGIDPREEHVVRVLASKLSVEVMALEELKSEVVATLEARRATAQASADAVRFILSDRIPGPGVVLASRAAELIAPRRYRDEIVSHVAAGSPVVLSKRHALSSADKQRALAIGWAAALWDDPTWSRRALLRARHDRIAADLGDDGARARKALDDWMIDALAPAAFPMSEPLGDSR